MAHWALVLPRRPEYEFPSTHVERADMAVHIHDPELRSRDMCISRAYQSTILSSGSVTDPVSRQ